jgi:hypothetical protein
MSMHLLPFVPCRRAAALIDKRAATGISYYENLQLFLHKSICAGCQCYEKQSAFLDQVSKKVHSIVSEPKRLPHEVKMRMIETLKKK